MTNTRSSGDRMAVSENDHVVVGSFIHQRIGMVFLRQIEVYPVILWQSATAARKQLQVLEKSMVPKAGFEPARPCER